MNNILKVSGGSLVRFMSSFHREAIKRGSNVLMMTEAIENNFGLLEQNPEGIPINLPNENGRLFKGWIDAMAAGNDSFGHLDWFPHWHLSGTGLDGKHNHKGNIRGLRDQYEFVTRKKLAIRFQKRGFPSKEELTTGIYAGAKETFVADVKHFGSLYLWARDVTDMMLLNVGQINFSGSAEDMELLACCTNDSLRERLVQDYKIVIKNLEVIDRVFKNPYFLAEDNASLGLNAGICFCGNRGIFNTKIIASGQEVYADVLYDCFSCEGGSYLTDRDKFPLTSSLSFSRSVFPEQISSFLEALQQTVGTDYRNAFHFDVYFLHETIEKLEKKEKAPNSFFMSIYLHNNSRFPTWQIALYI